MAKIRSTTGIVLVILAAAAGGWFLWHAGRDKGPEFYTAPVERGDLTQTITATGVIQPFLDVLVSCQVSGYVNGLMADFNSKVRKGDLLATLLPTNYQAALKSAEGDLANARANFDLQKIMLDRDKELLKRNLIAQSDYDTQAALVAEAAAQVQIKGAAVDTARTNLSYCEIRSPMDGMVIRRAVDIGNSVAATLSSPTLFEIGNDLTKMQIDASVAEADIGNVALDQEVNFSVDAYPNRQFHGKVYQIRNAPQTQQNVVIYDVMISVSNGDLKLKPGMTANVQIIVARRSGVLRIANSALRFRMPDSLVASVPAPAKQASAAVSPASAGIPTPRTLTSEERRKQLAQLMQDAGYARGSGPPSPEIRQKMVQLAHDRGIDLPERLLGGGRGAGGGDAAVFRTIYRLPGGAAGAHPEPVRVSLGVSDGSQTEVLGGLSEGDIVVTGINQAAQAVPAGGQQPNPFGGRGFGGGYGR